MSNYSSFNYAGLRSLVDSLKNAHGIVIDLRKASPNNDEDYGYYESEFMKRLIALLADDAVIYPSMRTRIHYGHESETFNSSFYSQGWLLANGTSVNSMVGLAASLVM